MGQLPRIPVTWLSHFDIADPKHRIDPAFLARVREVADMVLAEGMVAVVNVHHDGGYHRWNGWWLSVDGRNEALVDAFVLAAKGEPTPEKIEALCRRAHGSGH